ncbi:hypothetical protein P43SY_002412 [Pythium insidiosum]|uniref:Uncharacterized protein n=1 Tax=Pythium insidiosum TaxID=114742 RepID=A0AAD5LZQ0_PYTIN|nr:hypothetical protein P43SY_002412 [Pythium insidiosum]
MATTRDEQELQAEERSCPWHRVTQETLATDFHSHDFDPRFVSPDGLSVGLAWSLATQWADRLRGVVRLGSDRTNEQFCVAPNYEWIDVRVGCSAGSASQGSHAGGPSDAAERPDVASAIRAAVLVWRALSCCRGFSAQENPVFWKRLFDSVRVPTSERNAPDPFGCCHRDAGDDSPVVSDAHRFFEGVAFPRLRLGFCRDPGNSTRLNHDVRVISGLVHGHLDIQAEQQAALTTLGPFIRGERLRKLSDIELCIDLSPHATSELEANRLIALLRSSSLDTPGLDCLSTEEGLESCGFQVTAVETEDWWTPYMSASYAMHIQFGRHLDVPIARRRILRQNESPDNDYVPGFPTFREYLLWALNPKRRRPGGIRHLTFAHRDDELAIPAICSALPFTTTLDTLTLDTADHWNNKIDYDDIAWLGYALFHPDTSSSAWKRLCISQLYVRFKGNGDEFQLMAQGNNLARALGVTDHISDKYYKAAIRAGAVIRSKPTEDDGYVVETLRETTEMDVCVKSTDVSRLSEWVFVVVIGYGAAWVRREDVEHVVARAPGRPKLTALDVHCAYHLATIRAGAVIHEKPANDSKLVETLNESTEMDVCVESTDVALLSRPPLTALTMEPFTLQTNVVAALVRLTSGTLQFLRQEDFFLRAIDAASLSIPAISTRVESELIVPPAVRELEVRTCCSKLFALVPRLAQLHELEVLRVTATGGQSDWDEGYLALVQELLHWLLRSLPRLRYFSFVDCSTNESDLLVAGAGSASQGSHAGGPSDAAERPDVASAIRAAVLVWRALSCCRGFSAQEHPVFWRCVFDTMTVRSPDAATAAANGASTCCRDLRDSTARVVSDVYRFFDGVSFPRLRLIACQDRAVGTRLEHDLRVLCGRDAPDAGVKAAMKSALQTLARFACQGRLSTQATMDVSFGDGSGQCSNADMNALVEMLESARGVYDDEAEGEAAAEAKAKAKAKADIDIETTAGTDSAGYSVAATGSASVSRFGIVVKEVDTWDPWDRRIRVACTRFIPHSASDSSLRKKVLDALHPKVTRPGGARLVEVAQGDEDRPLTAICSALPFTTTVETVDLTSADHWSNELDHRLLAWLGYALFHPDTCTSTWRNLKVNQLYNRWKSDAEDFELMAQGNNLARALGLTDHVSSAYHLATIRAGAAIHEKPADDSKLVETLNESTEMDVCVESTDVALLSEWVFAIVVGFGGAWVRRGDVERIVARPPGRPQLTAVSMDVCKLELNIVAALVRLTSGTLEFIRLEEHVLRAVDAAAFSIPAISTRVVSNLVVPLGVRELHLRIDCSRLFGLAPVLAQLRELEMLRLTITGDWDETYLALVQELLQWLLRSLPRLQRFVIVESRASEVELLSLGGLKQRLLKVKMHAYD